MRRLLAVAADYPQAMVRVVQAFLSSIDTTAHRD